MITSDEKYVKSKYADVLGSYEMQTILPNGRPFYKNADKGFWYL